jgi:ABC-type branched-subunit amino acid transport system ATPase component
VRHNLELGSVALVQKFFSIPRDSCDRGVANFLIEQDAKQALQISDYEQVLKQGQARIEDSAPRIFACTRIAQLFLGGDLPRATHVS